MSTDDLLERAAEYTERHGGLLVSELADALRESERQLSSERLALRTTVASLLESERQMADARAMAAADRVAVSHWRGQVGYERGRAETAEANIARNAGVLVATDPTAACARAATLEHQLAECKAQRVDAQLLWDRLDAVQRELVEAKRELAEASLHGAFAKVARADPQALLARSAKPECTCSEIAATDAGFLPKVNPACPKHGAKPPTSAQTDDLERQRDAERELRAKAEADVERLTRELADANHWRERHCRDSEAASKQSCANWNEVQRLTRELARVNDEDTAEMRDLNDNLRRCVVVEATLRSDVERLTRELAEARDRAEELAECPSPNRAAGRQVSGAGTAAKPPFMWCWACSRRLHSRFHRVVIGPDGHEHVVHADCARRDGLEIVPGKHLAARRSGR